MQKKKPVFIQQFPVYIGQEEFRKSILISGFATDKKWTLPPEKIKIKQLSLRLRPHNEPSPPVKLTFTTCERQTVPSSASLSQWPTTHTPVYVCKDWTVPGINEWITYVNFHFVRNVSLLVNWINLFILFLAHVEKFPTSKLVPSLNISCNSSMRWHHTDIRAHLWPYLRPEPFRCRSPMPSWLWTRFPLQQMTRSLFW